MDWAIAERNEAKSPRPATLGYMAGAAPTITLATWNIRMGLHNDGGRNDVASICQSFDADVVILQEAWLWGEEPSTLTAEVATALGADCHEYVSSKISELYPAYWTVAIFCRVPSEPLDSRQILSTPDRDRALVRVRLPDHGLTIAGGHFEGIHALRSRPWLWMRQHRQLPELLTDVDVVAGDFNMWGPVVDYGLPGFRRAARGRTWPAQRPHSQIDHILVNERVEVLKGEVLDNYNSDHRPVLATLRARG